MKKQLLYFAMFFLIYALPSQHTTAQRFANTALSNLARTSVNKDLVPKTNGTLNLGGDKAWKNLYLSEALYLGPGIFLSAPLDNTFTGYGTGNANTSGSGNTANGFQALYSNTTGAYNTAVGYGSLV